MIKEIAMALNGMEQGESIPRTIRQQCINLRIVVVYGASDDLMEFDGAIRDELGAYDGGTEYINSEGIYEEKDECCYECKFAIANRARCKSIEAIWNGGNGYSWEYKTDIPHETFEIMEDGEKYCKGIVFSLNDLDANK